MNFDGLGGLVPFDPVQVSWPGALIGVLPADVRGEVDAAVAAHARLAECVFPEALSAHEVARGLAARMDDAAFNGVALDPVSWAAAVVAEADAVTVATMAHRLAVSWARDRVIAACVEAAPAALGVWSRRVVVLASEVDVLLSQGAMLDELEARRGSKADVQRWESLMALLDEYDAIRDAFTDTRVLLDRSDTSDRFALGSAFRGVYESRDGDVFSAELTRSGHALIAGVRLGWSPWCPTRAEQLADEQDAIRATRESSVRVPRHLLVN